MKRPAKTSKHALIHTKIYDLQYVYALARTRSSEQIAPERAKEPVALKRTPVGWWRTCGLMFGTTRKSVHTRQFFGPHRRLTTADDGTVAVRAVILCGVLERWPYIVFDAKRSEHEDDRVYNLRASSRRCTHMRRARAMSLTDGCWKMMGFSRGEEWTHFERVIGRTQLYTLTHL